LANGIAVFIEASIGLTILSIRWKGVDARRILLDTSKALLAAGVMSGVVLLLKPFLPGGDLVLLVLGGAVGMVIYFGVAYLLGIKEIVQVPLAILRRKDSPLD
jgi:peptidoglycan biosynthesis protein MviN/MurJ (putative lipid II flippase)